MLEKQKGKPNIFKLSVGGRDQGYWEADHWAEHWRFDPWPRHSTLKWRAPRRAKISPPDEHLLEPKSQWVHWLRCCSHCTVTSADLVWGRKTGSNSGCGQTPERARSMLCVRPLWETLAIPANAKLILCIRYPATFSQLLYSNELLAKGQTIQHKDPIIPMGEPQHPFKSK